MLIDEINNGYRIKLKLSFLNEKSFKINKFGDELVVELANKRHHVLLPKFTNFHRLSSYNYETPWLLIDLHKNN